MPARFVAMLTVFVAVICGAHYYVGRRLIVPAQLSGPWTVVAWGALALLAVTMLIAMTGRFYLPPPIMELVGWAGFVAMGLFSFLFFFSVLRDVIWGSLSVAQALPEDPERRRLLFRSVNLGLVASAAGLTGFGVWQARRRAAIVDVTVPIVGLPEALRNFTIAQITDIHVGPTIKRAYLEEIVEGVNSIGADLVAVTGDLVDGSVEELAQHTAPLGRLRGKHGVFLCTGNHEYYAGVEPWLAEFTRLGLRCLQNEHVVIEHGGYKVVLAGVTDYNGGTILASHRSDPARSLEGAPTGVAARILLAHQPRSCHAAAGLDFDLQISGHTHGGQFFPWNFLVPLQQPYTAGLARVRAATSTARAFWIYVSRGTGYWGPPVRVGAPSEITRIRLVPAAAADASHRGA